VSEETQHCIRCGRALDPDHDDVALGLCGDCYWDDQTDEDGDI